jgi:hypothetical protein
MYLSITGMPIAAKSLIIKGRCILRRNSGEKRLTMEYIPQLRMPLSTRKLKKTLAQLAGVSRDTLRHYERRGLLPAAQRSQNGYRHYPPQALERVRLIRGALGIGFTVDELRDILQSRDRGVAPCHQVHALAMDKARGPS